MPKRELKASTYRKRLTKVRSTLRFIVDYFEMQEYFAKTTPTASGGVDWRDAHEEVSKNVQAWCRKAILRTKGKYKRAEVEH